MSSVKNECGQYFDYCWLQFLSEDGFCVAAVRYIYFVSVLRDMLSSSCLCYMKQRTLRSNEWYLFPINVRLTNKPTNETTKNTNKKSVDRCAWRDTFCFWRGRWNDSVSDYYIILINSPNSVGKPELIYLKFRLKWIKFDITSASNRFTFNRVYLNVRQGPKFLSHINIIFDQNNDNAHKHTKHLTSNLYAVYSI